MTRSDVKHSKVRNLPTNVCAKNRGHHAHPQPPQPEAAPGLAATAGGLPGRRGQGGLHRDPVRGVQLGHQRALPLQPQRGQRHPHQLRQRGLPGRLPRAAAALLHPGVQPAGRRLAAAARADLHRQRHPAQDRGLLPQLHAEARRQASDFYIDTIFGKGLLGEIAFTLQN